MKRREFCCLLGLPLAARAQANLQRGKRIIDDCVAAMGGDRFLHMQERMEEGRAYSFYREQISGLSIAKIYTHYLSGVTDTANNLGIEEREYFGKHQDSSVLFTPTDGYEINYKGAHPITADRFARYKETTLRNVLYILRVRLREPGLIFDSRGADVFDNRPVEIVEITDAQNRTTTVFFDQSYKWPVRQHFITRDEKTRDRNEEITEYTKYRDIGGVNWPLSIQRERNGEKIYQMFSEHTKLNESTPENMFRLPSGITILKPG
jgi:hypothetical protein